MLTASHAAAFGLQRLAGRRNRCLERGYKVLSATGILRQSRGDHSSEHSAGDDAKHGDRNGDGQLEVV